MTVSRHVPEWHFPLLVCVQRILGFRKRVQSGRSADFGLVGVVGAIEVGPCWHFHVNLKTIETFGLTTALGQLFK